MSYRIDQPMASLPVQIYNYAISPFEDWQRQAWGGAFVLIIIVLGINLSSRPSSIEKNFIISSLISKRRSRRKRLRNMEDAKVLLSTKNLECYFGDFHAVKGISIEYREKSINAIIGRQDVENQPI